MKTPVWTKPGIYGAMVGAAAIAIVGFGWGGWMTEGKAKQLAASQSRAEVVAALVPICLEQSKRDAQLAARLTDLKAASSYNRSDMLMKIGWATMPGAADANREVATACLEKLSAGF